MQQTQLHQSTIDPEEIERFSRIADEWWDERGKFAPLHRINPLRIEWIKESIQRSGFSMQGLNMLDIGCGGGLVCEPLARLGASVTGIDASEKNIGVASVHAKKMGLNIRYECTSAESFLSSLRAKRSNPGSVAALEQKERDRHVADAPCDDGFDVVTALEIIEHVADIPAFIEATCQLLKPGGLIFYSTLNRTAKSYALAIIGAEYVLRWLPKGTHTWSKFVKPHELVRELERNSIEIVDMRGMVMHPFTQAWRWDKADLSVNYALMGKKIS